MLRASGSRRVVAIAASAAVLVATSLVFAQQIWVGGYRGYGGGARFAKPHDFDGTFLYCRGYYQSRWQEAGGSGWRTDYPGADNNFSVRLAELTRVPVKFDPDRQPHYVVIPLTDATLFRCPILFMEDVGTVDFSAQEVKQLREFFQKGGFLWTDDAWGSIAWANWVEQIARVLPPGEFPLVDVPITHPMLHVLYNVTSIPQVPNIGFWRSTGGQTSERGPDSAQVYFKGIFDSHKRLMVLTSHNTDISDTWEREGAPPHEYFDLFSPRGYAIGVNVILYAMTH
jgi:Domain of unknown function (DUF4159)